MPHGTPARLALHRRRGWHACATTVILLLVLQPVLCLVTCALAGSEAGARGYHAAARQAAPPADGLAQRFVCHLPLAPTAQPHLVPAFWPGILTVLLALILRPALLWRLTPARPVGHPRPRWAPPLRPPRYTLAA